MEQEEFLQKLPSESRGSVRKVLSKAVGEDIWNTIKEANSDELIQIPGIKEKSAKAIQAVKKKK